MNQSQHNRLRAWRPRLDTCNEAGNFWHRLRTGSEAAEPPNPGGGAQIFQKPKRHLNILGAKIMTRNKFRTDGTQVLGAIVQNLVAPATWRPGYVHSSPNQWDKVVWTGK